MGAGQLFGRLKQAVSAMVGLQHEPAQANRAQSRWYKISGRLGASQLPTAPSFGRGSLVTYLYRPSGPFLGRAVPSPSATHKRLVFQFLKISSKAPLVKLDPPENLRL